MSEEPVDNLEQKLMSTRYSVIDGMKSVKSSLEKEHNLQKQNKQKAKDMKRKLTQLEVIQRKVNKEAYNFQRKLHKLENSQDYAILLMQLKQIEIEKREKDLNQRKKNCTDIKNISKQKRQMSLNYFHNKKAERIKRMKEQNFHSYLELQKRKEEEDDRRRKSSQSIKQKQYLAKQRMRRYEKFKIQQAQSNYDLKRQTQMQRYSEHKNELQQLRQKVKEQEQIFRKTQILNRQTTRIQSIYLTSQS